MKTVDFIGKTIGIGNIIIFAPKVKNTKLLKGIVKEITFKDSKYYAGCVEASIAVMVTTPGAKNGKTVVLKGYPAGKLTGTDASVFEHVFVAL